MFLCDFHSHIMPGVDHGSSGIETTEKQIEIIKKSAVGSVVATPHFYPHVHILESFLDARRRALKEMHPCLEKNGIDLYLGAEVLLCEGMERMEGLSELCIEGTNVLLIEMPFAHWSEGLLVSLGKICKLGFDVIMAHIDRYPSEQTAKIFDFCEPKIQLNADVFCDIWRRKKYLSHVKNGSVYALGSDFHGIKGYDRFTKALKFLGSENIEIIMTNTASLLKDADVYGSSASSYKQL